jgi:hypothetical protein
VDQEAGDLLPAKKVWDRYSVCSKTLDRWCASPDLGFPKPHWINKRRYFRLADLRAWEIERAAGRAA